jgi:hypothetical protein
MSHFYVYEALRGISKTSFVSLAQAGYHAAKARELDEEMGWTDIIELSEPHGLDEAGRLAYVPVAASLW